MRKLSMNKKNEIMIQSFPCFFRVIALICYYSSLHNPTLTSTFSIQIFYSQSLLTLESKSLSRMLKLCSSNRNIPSVMPPSSIHALLVLSARIDGGIACLLPLYNTINKN